MKKHGLYTIILGAVLAAMIAAATAFLKIPMPFSAQGGYIHAGDGLIYIAAMLLPAPVSMAAAAIGGALADIGGGYAVWAPWTAVIKLFMALVISLVCAGAEKPGLFKMLPASVLAGCVNLAGYYIAEGAIYGNFLTPVNSLLPNAAQSLCGALIFILLGPAIIALKKIGGKK